MEALDRRVSDLEKKTDSLLAENQVLRGAIVGLKHEVGILKTTLSALEECKDPLKKRTTLLESRVQRLEQRTEMLLDKNVRLETTNISIKELEDKHQAFRTETVQDKERLNITLKNEFEAIK